MARRHIRHGGNDRPRRRWRVKSLLALVAVVAAVWAAPAVIVQTSLRDRPLAAALAGIDGGITSGGATWRWLGGVEYRDVVLRDRAGRAAVILPYLALDRGSARLRQFSVEIGPARRVGVAPDTSAHSAAHWRSKILGKRYTTTLIKLPTKRPASANSPASRPVTPVNITPPAPV